MGRCHLRHCYACMFYLRQRKKAMFSAVLAFLYVFPQNCSKIINGCKGNFWAGGTRPKEQSTKIWWRPGSRSKCNKFIRKLFIYYYDFYSQPRIKRDKVFGCSIDVKFLWPITSHSKNLCFVPHHRITYLLYVMAPPITRKANYCLYSGVGSGQPYTNVKDYWL